LSCAPAHPASFWSLPSWSARSRRPKHRVNDKVQTARSRWRMGNLAWPLIAGLALGGPRDSTAHEPLAACVQHRLQLTVGARYIDLTLDLTFFEEWSARERRAMDADGNGRITRLESESYLKNLAPVLAQHLRLR